MAENDQCKGVWIFAEQNKGRIAKSTYELLGKGRELADLLDVELTACLLGKDVKEKAQELIYHGADKVLLCDDAIVNQYRTESYCAIIVDQVRQRKPEILLVGATRIGRDLAPRIARRLNTGCTADCTALDIDHGERLLIQTRPAFGGNIMASIVCPERRPQMATVRPGVMEALARDPGRVGEIINVTVEIHEEDLRTKIMQVVEEVKKEGRLEEAKRIVSGGAGVGGPEGFQIAPEISRTYRRSGSSLQRGSGTGLDFSRLSSWANRENREAPSVYCMWHIRFYTAFGRDEKFKIYCSDKQRP